MERARGLDRDASDAASSWGAFQVMGFLWRRLRYDSVRAFVFSMSSHGDDGQTDAFVRFVEADPALRRALRLGQWEVVETLYNGGGFGGAYAQKLRAAAALCRTVVAGWVAWWVCQKAVAADPKVNCDDLAEIVKALRKGRGEPLDKIGPTS